MGGNIRPEIAPSPSPSPSQDKCMPWTNKKHNRYLNYLEASFVRQLHSTMDSKKTWCTDHTEMEGSIHQSLPFILHISSEEVSSVPYRKCQEINFGKDQPHPCTVSQPLSLDVYERQCKKHQLRHAVKDSSTDLQELHSRDKNTKRIKSNCYKRSSLEDSYLSRFCHHSSDESVVECTDQNFVDDSCRNHSPNASRAKKLKIAAALEDTVNGDQIPFEALYSSDKLTVLVHSSLEEEGGKT